MIELYRFSNSICSERVRTFLHEKGITGWISDHVDPFKGEQFNPEHMKLSPKAEPLTSAHNGHVIREAALIDFHKETLSDDFIPEEKVQAAERKLTAMFGGLNAKLAKHEWILADIAWMRNDFPFGFFSNLVAWVDLWKSWESNQNAIDSYGFYIAQKVPRL